MKEGDKPIHVKPALYAEYFYILKEIAFRYGYNLVIHGSLHRDLDLIAIPWQRKLRPHKQMIYAFAKRLNGEVEKRSIDEMYSLTNHGRMQYVINIHRFVMRKGWNYGIDLQYYLDISVIPVTKH